MKKPIECITFFVNDLKKIRGDNNKSFAISMILLMMLSSVALISSIPVSKSATVPVLTLPTHAFIAVSANPIGIGQSVEVIAFLSEISDTANGLTGTTFSGYTITITAPDGTNQTMGPYTADPISNAYILFTPTALGTYKFQFSYPGQWINGTPASTTTWPPSTYGFIDLYYQPSLSNSVSITVQQQQIASYPDTPFPTEYWSNPINAENRNWASITGDWLEPQGPYSAFTSYSQPAADRYQPNGTAPNGGHIMWTRNIAPGGVVGGAQGDNDYYTGQSYEPDFQPIIMNGVLYYTTPNPPREGFFAVDLRTGQQIYYANYTAPTTITSPSNAISVGQEYSYETQNQFGAFAYLWSEGTTYTMYDAATGNLILYAANATTGQTAYGPDGSLLVFNAGRNWISMWNSSLLLPTAAATSAGAQEVRPDLARGKTLNWQNGIIYNVSTADIPGQAILHVDYPDNVIITYTLQVPGATTPTQELFGYNAATGALLWNKTETGQLGMVSTFEGMGPAADGIYAEATLGNQQWTVFDVKTGNILYTILPPANQTSGWAVYNMIADIDPANHLLFTTSYDGIINAYNDKTVALLWTYTGPNSGIETPYGVYPFGGLAGTIQLTVVDGKLYATTGEHSPNVPLYRGEYIVCLDENTGMSIWKETGWWQFPAFSDGYMVALNGYDNTIYSFGKGPSSTTVQTPLGGVTQGQGFTIQGTVMDVSAGASQPTIKANYPNGLPAISDADQSAWMEYVYQQQPFPSNASGVPVSIDAIDPNGNLVHLGSTHSDSSGMYSFQVNPSIVSAGPGTYTVIATFAGSNSYWPSNSESSFTLNPTPTVAPTITPQTNLATTTDVMTYMAVGVIAIIVAIAIVGILLLRKRP